MHFLTPVNPLKVCQQNEMRFGLNLSARQTNWKLWSQVNINRRNSAFVLEAWEFEQQIRGIVTLKMYLSGLFKWQNIRILILLRHLHSYYKNGQVRSLKVLYKKIQISLWKATNTLVTKNLTWYSCGLRPVLPAETHSRAWTQLLEKMLGISKQPYCQQPFWINFLIAVLLKCLWGRPISCVQYVSPVVPTLMGFISTVIHDHKAHQTIRRTPRESADFATLWII